MTNRISCAKWCKPDDDNGNEVDYVKVEATVEGTLRSGPIASLHYRGNFLVEQEMTLCEYQGAAVTRTYECQFNEVSFPRDTLAVHIYVQYTNFTEETAKSNHPQCELCGCHPENDCEGT